jgi:glycine/D-amino acid oxidase-like deaminating enzyme
MHCIKAESDQTFYAKHVVYANNAWIGQILPFAKDLVVPTRGQVITTKPLPNYWKTGLLFNDGYDYMIQRKDGRVVLGGGRLESETEEQPELDDSTIHPSISKVLRSFLNSYLDVKEPVEIEEEWTGIMGFSPDELPLVGPVPGMKNQYMAAGFTGHGMPVTFLSAKALADMILGKEVFLPEIYNPQRFVPK